MILGRAGVSVQRLVKPLVEDFDKITEVHVGDRVHRFRCAEYDGFGLSHVLFYEAEDNEGDIRQWKYLLNARPSNLPQVDALRWYIYHKGHNVQKLHYTAFTDGAFFFVRHQYRHTYACQNFQRQKQWAKTHLYEQKINDLLDSKQKLRLTYDGKPTRTKHRLDKYADWLEYYEDLSFVSLVEQLKKVGIIRMDRYVTTIE